MLEMSLPKPKCAKENTVRLVLQHLSRKDSIIPLSTYVPYYPPPPYYTPTARYPAPAQPTVPYPTPVQSPARYPTPAQPPSLYPKPAQPAAGCPKPVQSPTPAYYPHPDSYSRSSYSAVTA
ncbi:hypothetical protein GHT06_020675 [Daphnia sinensis]|uniref:Uncharacterized protein n=1 Tax=Daphnia sinensis TaxID=1820382 RepID=A0AAD5PRQ9_9CRUS|nr:hypothetical protein GHT06_020675 [Daphnia sinensis]